MSGFFIFDGHSSKDYGLEISGADTYSLPGRNYTFTHIPGRSGDLLDDDGDFNNVKIVYHCTAIDRLSPALDELAALLMTQRTYAELEDTYHPDVFRYGVCTSGIDVEALRPQGGAPYLAGNFDIEFTCKPQKYLKSGQNVIKLTADGTVYNPTAFAAKPLLKVYGNGVLGIGSETITIANVSNYIFIDCDMQDAYKGTVNCNDRITLSSDDFPTLPAGESGITLSGLTRVEITPRWWKL